MNSCDNKIVELYEEINGLYSKNRELCNEIKRLEAEMITPLENIVIKNRNRIGNIRRELRKLGEKV